MSWSRFILQRGFDCHVLVIDCSKDRGKSRNVITALLRSLPLLSNQWEVKRAIDLCWAKTEAWDTGLGLAGHAWQRDTDTWSCQQQPLGFSRGPLKIVLPLGYSPKARDIAAVCRPSPRCPLGLLRSMRGNVAILRDKCWCLDGFLSNMFTHPPEG